GVPVVLVGGIENSRAIARAAIVALAVQRGWIVNLKEEFQQFAVADQRRIEHDLHRFGMASVIAIGCVRHVAAGIADPRGDDAWIAAQQILYAPKTPACENRALVRCGHGMAPSGNDSVAYIGRLCPSTRRPRPPLGPAAGLRHAARVGGG